MKPSHQALSSHPIQNLPPTAPTAPAPSVGVSGADLRTAVGGMLKVVSRKPTSAVLGCVRLESLDRPPEGRLCFTAIGPHLTLRLEIPARFTGDSVHPPYLLPFDRLRDLARAARSHDRVPLPPMPRVPPVEEFPPCPAVSGPVLALPEEAITGMLRAFTCASSDVTRPVLMGACFDGADAPEFRAVGTDGRHLYRGPAFRLPGLPPQLILPDHPVWTWKPLRESRSWTLRLGPETQDAPRTFEIAGPWWSITGRCLEGHYPNHRPVVPRSDQLSTRVDLPASLPAELVRLLPVLPGHRLSQGPVGIEVTSRGKVHLLCRESPEDPWEIRALVGARAQGPAMTVVAKREHLARALAFGMDRIDLVDEHTVLRFGGEDECLLAMPLPLPPDLNVSRSVVGPAIDGTIPLRSGAGPSRKSPMTAPAPPKRVNPPAQPPGDPVAEAEGQLSSLRQSIRGLREGLGSVAAALKLVRRQRREDDRRVRSKQRDRPSGNPTGKAA